MKVESEKGFMCGNASAVGIPVASPGMRRDAVRQRVYVDAHLFVVAED